MKCRPEKFPLRIKVPVEHGESSVRASVTPVDERIFYSELYSAIRASVRARPWFSVAVSRPDVDLRKLPLEAFKLDTFFHGFSVEQRKILKVHNSRRPVNQ